jgi:hypothetical protein
VATTRRLLAAGLVGVSILGVTLANTLGGGDTVPDARDTTPRLANLWWDVDGGSCRRSATPRAYDDAAACTPPARESGDLEMTGWTIAQDGDVIGVYDEPGGDEYGVLTTGADAKTATIRGMGLDGSVPEFSQAVIACDACKIENVKFENRAPARDVEHDWICQGPTPDYGGADGMFLNGIVNICSSATLRNVEIDGLLNGATCLEGANIEAPGATIRGGSIHGIVDRKGVAFHGSDLTFDGIDFYDIKRMRQCGGVDPHNECLYTAGGYDGLTFRNNRLLGCPSGQGLAMLGSCSGGEGPSNILIEGNVFGRTNEGSGVDLRTDWHGSGGIRSLFIGASACDIDSGWTVRYNTFETVPDADSADELRDGPGNGQWYGNLGAADCSARWNYHHNVGDTCSGADSVSVSPSTNTPEMPDQMAAWYRDAYNWDYHLKPGAAAIGAGDPENKPSRDLDGTPRADPPTAGAYEYAP